MELMFETTHFGSTAKLVMGKPINDAPVTMESVMNERDNVTVWGEIFNVEKKETKSGKSTIITAAFSDRTSSMVMKLFVYNTKLDSYKFIENGTTILANGSYKMDEFMHYNCFNPQSIMIVDVKPKQDNAPDRAGTAKQHLPDAAPSDMHPDFPLKVANADFLSCFFSL